MDILKGGLEALTGGGNSGKTEGKGLLGGIFGKILETVGLKKPEIAAEARDAKEKAEANRSGIFGEVGKSLLLRQYPILSATTDLYKQLSGNKAAEQVPWQNEFESISAVVMLLTLIPGKWKHYLTDVFAESTVFRTLVEYWPGLDGVDIPFIGGFLPDVIGKGGNIRQRILNDKDPTAVIAALRVIHQDLFVTGKVSFDVVKNLLGGNTAAAAAAVLGGGAALTAGARALEGGGDSAAASPSGQPVAVDAVREAVAGTGALRDKKILDMQKQHPEKQATTMQTKLLALLKSLNVLDTAVLVDGEWFGNNDEVTVGYIFDNGTYFLTYDEDITSADISVRNAQGMTIYDETDYWGLNAEANASSITAAMRQNPSEAPAAAPAAAAAPTPATDNTVSVPATAPANDNNAGQPKAA